MNTYKIVYLITNCKKTGPMNQTLNIIRNLDKDKFTPIIITIFPECENNSMIDSYKEICKEVYCLNMNKFSSILYGRKKLKVLLEEIKPDLIHSVGMPPYTMSLAYEKSKHLVTLRNYCYEDYPSKYGKVLGNVLAVKDMNLIKKQVKKGEIFVTCSKSLSNIYKKEHNFNFKFIRNGVDISKYNPISFEEKIKKKQYLGINNKLVYIYTGQMNDRKDQNSAIKSFLLSNIKDSAILILLGDGPNFNELKDKYSENRNVIFKGNVGNVVEYLQIADVYISTSKSEGRPNGVLEAMAVGLPVILSDIPQHKEIVDINNDIGTVYKIGDENELSQYIDNVEKWDMKTKMESSYNTVINNLTDKIMSRNYQDLYIDLIK